ncbi:MAG: LysR family transcriptional regulator [Rickettsiales bacterium]|nr:LysR family transcriptional regulator [Rickettsiales bacterium]
MSIDTITLECFILSAETGSFTKAANKIGRTQSAVSQQIIKLEQLVGKTLFKRGKQLELTDSGQEFLDYAKRIYKLHKEAMDNFKKTSLKGEVFFGIPDTFAKVFLEEILIEFRSKYPNILIHIECDLTLNLYENFKNKKLDVVLLKMKKPKKVGIGVEISSEKLYWVGNEDLLKQNVHIPLVLHPNPCVYRSAAISALKRKNVKSRIVFSSYGYYEVVAAVKSNLGITILPEKMIPKDLQIIRSPILPSLGHSEVCLLKNNNYDPVVNFFEEFVIKHW